MIKSRTLKSYFLFVAILSLIRIFWAAESGSCEKISSQVTLNQMIADLQKNATDSTLREKIIMLVQTMKPAPAIPEEARKHFVMAVTLQGKAKDTEGFELAISEYKEVLLIAPWWPEAYNNMGILLEQVGQYDEAMRAFKLYVLTNPKDAREAQDKIYAIEAAKKMAETEQEKADKEKASIQDTEEKKRQGIAALERLRGTWYGRNCAVGQDYYGGCTDAEANGRNWDVFKGPEGPFVFNFTFPGDGTVKLDAYESWASCENGFVWGVAQGPLLKNIRWELRDKEGRPIREVYSEISENGNWLEISCDRPLSGANPRAKYHYVIWTRNPNP